VVVVFLEVHQTHEIYESIDPAQARNTILKYEFIQHFNCNYLISQPLTFQTSIIVNK